MNKLHKLPAARVPLQALLQIQEKKLHEDNIISPLIENQNINLTWSIPGAVKPASQSPDEAKMNQISQNDFIKCGFREVPEH